MPAKLYKNHDIKAWQIKIFYFPMQKDHNILRLMQIIVYLKLKTGQEMMAYQKEYRCTINGDFTTPIPLRTGKPLSCLRDKFNRKFCLKEA